MSKNSNKKITGRLLLIRILAGLLALLMIAGVFYVAIEFIFSGVAAEAAELELDNYAFSSSKSNGDYYVAVAIRWRTNSSPSHEIVSPYGFAIGQTDIQRDSRSFLPLFLTDETCVVFAPDANLKIGTESASFASGIADTDIGGYNVELRFSQSYLDAVESMIEASEAETVPEITVPEQETTVPEITTETSASESTEVPGTSEETGSSASEITGSSAEESSAVAEPETSEEVTGDIPYAPVPFEIPTTEIWDTLEDLQEMFVLAYEHVYPAYINGEKTIRVGAFADFATATAAAGAIGAYLDGFDVSVVSPSTDGVMILNEDYDTVLFEYEGSGSLSCGLCARQRPDSERMYMLFSGNEYMYDGVLCARRYNDGTANVLTLINLVGLAEYTEGVLPAEVYTSWPKETLKAFAVAVNSFVIRNRNRRYNSYGCDLVASGEDQNYKGRTGVNANVIAACEEVSDSILVFTKANGKKAVSDCAYMSSLGGYSCEAQYVWGNQGDPYLISQPTVWEKYTAVSLGKWTYEITPKDFASLVKNYDSSLISGTYVQDVSYECVPGSTYVYSMTVTDNKNKSGTVILAARVNSLMGSYTKSANFVIGKDEVDFIYDEVISNEIIDLSTNYSGNLNVKTANSIFTAGADIFSFFTGSGISDKDESAAMYVKTSGGVAVLTSEKDIPMTTMPDENGYYTYVSDYGSFLIVSHLKQHVETVKAKTSGNFVIAGKGFGHGVGMSQWGACHLGQAGAKYNHILLAYYPGTEIASFSEWWKNN